MILFHFIKENFKDNLEVNNKARRISENDGELFKLITGNNVSKKELIQWVEKRYQVKYIDLSNEDIKKDILKIPNINVLKRNHSIPYKLENGKMYFAISNVIDYSVKNTINNLFKGGDVETIFNFAFEGEIAEAYEILENKEEEIEEFKEIIIKETKQSPETEFEATKWVNKVLNSAINYNASDIHIEPLENSLQVRYRIDGILTNKENYKIPLETRTNITNRIKVISKMKEFESRKAQDGRIEDFQKGKYLYDFRVSSVKGNFGEKIVMRIFNKTSEILTFEQLGFDIKEKEKILKMLKKNNGIIYLAGATGSGKTTTLYTMIETINSDDINIYTIENPIEKTVKNVTQIQIDEAGGITYIDTLSALLRQDPDVIVVGETRDNETANLAIRASLTGHLVMTTIHANNSIDTISRLIDMEVEPYLLSGSALGFISQRLIRTLCPHCKKKVKKEDLEGYEQKWIEDTVKEFNLENLSDKDFYIPVGCEHCNKGYKGRTALTETIEVTESIKAMIIKKEESIKIKRVAMEEGFQPFAQNGLELALTGNSSIGEIISKIL